LPFEQVNETASRTGETSGNEMGIKKKIGIKYCGGCNPTYERTEMIKRVQSQLKDQIFFLRHDEQGLDGLILVNGCPRSCAVQTANHGEIFCHSITRENDFGTLIERLTAFHKP
jgi:hypothetical protein